MFPHPGFRLARTLHPETSHKAAEEVAGTLAEKHRATVLRVRAFPGLTASEYDNGGARVYGKRLPECAAAGLIKRGEVRACRVTGRMATTWWPA